MMIYEETDDRFYIGESILENAGSGLFAKVPIKKDDWLEISGVLVAVGGVADKCTHYAKRYKFCGSPKKKTHKIVPMGYAAIVNHTDNPELQNVRIEHVPGLQKRSQHTSQMVYRFLKDVEPGQEILGHYGDNIDLELKNFNEKVNVAKDLKNDWDVFMTFDLYGLKEKIAQL